MGGPLQATALVVDVFRQHTEVSIVAWPHWAPPGHADYVGYIATPFRFVSARECGPAFVFQDFALQINNAKASICFPKLK